jgi:hypothetical protein
MLCQICLAGNFYSNDVNYKGIKNNTNSGKIAGIKDKLDTTCK